jgi:hypothetical protein
MAGIMTDEPPHLPIAGKAASPSERLRRISREDALQAIEPATLAAAFRQGQPVYLGRGQWWTWQRDGIPVWLVPLLQDLGFLP